VTYSSTLCIALHVFSISLTCINVVVHIDGTFDALGGQTAHPRLEKRPLIDVSERPFKSRFFLVWRSVCP
jgi:hypothetical protein